MIRKFASRCIDINTEYCPCMLAETNHCVFCSHLKGEQVCNCNWTGSCILYEKQWNSKKQDLPGEETKVRIEIESPLTLKKEIGKHTYHLEFNVTPELAQGLKKAGSFIFMRRAGDPEFYYFPVGIMGVEDTLVQVVIEAIGPKSVRLLTDDTCSQIIVRGPYANGIFGQPWIDNTKSSKVILVAGGLGQPPAMPIARTLVSNGNQVTALVAPGKVGRAFIEAELRDLGIEVISIPSLRQTGLPLLRQIFASEERRPDLVVSAGPDDQHYALIAAMQAVDVNLPMAATNNATMCCGEGICGSCEKLTRDNKRVKTCKVQTDFTEFICD